MRVLSILLGASAAFDYKSISINAPRRIVTQDDIDAKFEEVDKPYALYPVDGPAEEGLCVLAEISLTAPGFAWKRDNYIVELLDDQAEPFATVSTGICDAAVCAGGVHEWSFPIDIDMRAALLPEFGDLEQGTTCACRVAVRRVVDKQLVRMRRLLQYAVAFARPPRRRRNAGLSNARRKEGDHRRPHAGARRHGLGSRRRRTAPDRCRGSARERLARIRRARRKSCGGRRPRVSAEKL